MIKKQRVSVLNILDYSTLFSILLLSVFVSLLSLIVPIAAQTLVNLLAFGKLLQPIVTLSLIVLILMAGLGALSIWQVIVIEIIQQKIMVHVSLALTRHFTQLSLDNFSTHHGPALVNRYFELLTVKKSLASLLLYGINLSLQVIFGLVLLLFYHPAFVLFDLFILFGVLLTVFGPYKKALISAKDECAQKHIIGAWLEEILINRYLFKFNQYPRYAISQTDKKLVGFLTARNRHFRQLIKHQIGFYTLSALASSLLLGLGGYLVIENQLSLGQLVAAEIILGALIYSFKRFGVLMENYYDLMAAADKLQEVLHLPNERPESERRDVELGFKPLKTIELSFHADNQPVLITPHEPFLLIASDRVSQDFVDQLLGFKALTLFSVHVNGVPVNRQHLMALRQYSLLINEPQWFSGSTYDNLVLNHRHTATDYILEKLNQLALLDKIMTLPQGLYTVIHEWQSTFSLEELIKLMIIRALITKPQLLIIAQAFDQLTAQEVNVVLTLLMNLTDTLVIITTQKNQLPELTNRVVLA
ncbi:toxin secretion ABC transporter ATP-binding protein [Legionella busanensis]|uniref:Toxin secretion ABC transporter ATP-binding protein n=1 Tax=Legionella busanensis TaxID=190655 RepID=A0A378K901_9GAMM|nr:ABC transporter ATP-binding protein [Legionella busanensis]STX81197.1 toxin secretion ABC transporter ATP-binding protein [Legionella busanensis]